MPVYSLQVGGQGIVWMLGWSGNWQQVKRLESDWIGALSPPGPALLCCLSWAHGKSVVPQDIWRDGSSVRIRIASATSSSTGARFCASIRPGEAFRLARLVVLPWTPDPSGRPGAAGYNVLRRFLRR